MILPTGLPAFYITAPRYLNEVEDILTMVGNFSAIQELLSLRRVSSTFFNAISQSDYLQRRFITHIVFKNVPQIMLPIDRPILLHNPRLTVSIELPILSECARHMKSTPVMISLRDVVFTMALNPLAGVEYNGFNYSVHIQTLCHPSESKNLRRTLLPQHQKWRFQNRLMCVKQWLMIFTSSLIIMAAPILLLLLLMLNRICRAHIPSRNPLNFSPILYLDAICAPHHNHFPSPRALSQYDYFINEQRDIICIDESCYGADYFYMNFVGVMLYFLLLLIVCSTILFLNACTRGFLADYYPIEIKNLGTKKKNLYGFFSALNSGLLRKPTDNPVAVVGL